MKAKAKIYGVISRETGEAPLMKRVFTDTYTKALRPLSSAAKAVFLEIIHIAKIDYLGTFEAPIRLLAKCGNLRHSYTTIQRAIEELIEAGIIEKVDQIGFRGATLYRFCFNYPGSDIQLVEYPTVTEEEHNLDSGIETVTNREHSVVVEEPPVTDGESSDTPQVPGDTTEERLNRYSETRLLESPDTELVARFRELIKNKLWLGDSKGFHAPLELNGCYGYKNNDDNFVQIVSCEQLDKYQILNPEESRSKFGL